MRVRLDTALVDRGLAESRERAKRLILAGSVRVDGQLADKASALVDVDSPVELTAREKYVSRGGSKLEAALTHLAISCSGLICADIGASTGGFTDCLLQHGAARVHAIDVGKGQLDYRLRQDARVIVHEAINARHLEPGALGEAVDLVTIDVSFISLEKILPAAVGLLKAGGTLVALIKPQFEAGRDQIGRGGVVRDASVHAAVQARIEAFGTGTLHLEWLGRLESPLLGPAGNREFLIGFRKPAS